ncbi:MAG: glycosyltransferase family 4 protein [Candidatus Eisenbacteria bacterium]
MRILQLTRSLSPTGGICHVAYNLAREFRRSGIPVTNATWFPPRGSGSVDLGDLHGSRLGALCRLIPAKHVRSLFEIPLFTIWATAWAHSHPDDIVIAHGDSMSGDLFVAHSCHRAAIGAKHKAGNRRWLLYPLHWFLLLREWAVFRGASTPYVVAISSWVRDELKRHYGVRDERIFTIPNGVDTDRFRPVTDKAGLRRKLGLREDGLLVLFVSNIFGAKGLECAIRTLTRPSVPDHCDLVVVGGDRAQPYRKLAVALGVSERVRFAGFVDSVEEYFAAADAFLLLSDYEAFGLVGLEALASGVPLISGGVGGIGEYLRDGENGLLVERNPDSVARALGALARDPALRERLSKNARKSAEPFGWNRVAARYLEVCERIHREKGL